MTGVTTFCARYLPALAPLIVLLVLWRLPPYRRRLLLLRGAIVLIAGVALAKGSGAIHHEPRPFVVNHMVPLIPHAADNSFPSDHTLLAFTCAFLLIPFSLPAAGATGLVATAVGLARVGCHLHWPLDIVGSLLLAAVANALAWIALRRDLLSSSGNRMVDCPPASGSRF